MQGLVCCLLPHPQLLRGCIGSQLHRRPGFVYQVWRLTGGTHAAGQAVAARAPGKQAGEAPAEPVRLRSAGDASDFAGFPRLEPLDAGSQMSIQM